MNATAPELSIVVLNYRTAERAVRALAGAREAAGHLSSEEIAVDNGSRDGSAEKIGRARSGARMIDLPENLGFAAGMNAGIRASSGACVLLLNSDIEAEPGSVEALLLYMDANPDVGLAAPLLVDENGRPVRSLIVQPTLWRVLIPALGKLRYRQWKRRVKSEPIEVEATEGAALLIRREVIDKIGVLDEDFFFYHENVEWCMRIRDAGLRVVLVPSARMKHLRGGSSGGVWLPARIELKRSEYQLLGKRFGGAIRCLAVARDIVSEAVRSAIYCVPGLSPTKRAVHVALLRWILMGMPDRRDNRYRSRFGVWE